MEFIALILAAVALLFSRSKQKQIDALQARLQALEWRLGKAYPAAEGPLTRVAAQAAAAPTGLKEAISAYEEQTASTFDEDALNETLSEAIEEMANELPPQPETYSRRASRPVDMERLVGVHLPIWGGAIMLLIAGFFLARMAADNGFFTPTLGVLACAAGAAVMLGSAVAVRRLQIANHGLIASALASASIGTLYATSFLSSAAFGLTSLFTGFVLSAGTAILALAIAFLFGKPVLIVGLIGGYLAPFFLLPEAPSELLVNLYLAALLLSGTSVCARNGWWNLLTPMILLHYAWLGGLLSLGFFGHGKAISTVVLLIATPLAVFFLAERQRDMLKANPSAAYLSTAISSLLLVAGAAMTQFDPLYVYGFCAMALAAGVMTFLGSLAYPTFVTAAAWLLLLVLWREPDQALRLAATMLVVASIVVPLSIRLLKGALGTLLSTIICGVVAASFVSTMIDLDGWGGMRDVPYVWALLALAFSGAAIFGAVIFGRTVPAEDQETVRGIFAASASAFVSLAIVAVVDPDYYALAAALQVLGLALVHHRYRVAALVQLAGGYAALYVGTLALSVFGVPSPYILGGFAPYWPDTPPWDAPASSLLLPAGAFLLAGTVLARSGRWPLIRMLDAAGVLLLACAASILILPDLSMLDARDTLLWASLWGNAMLLIGIAAAYAGRHFERVGMLASGLFLFFGTLVVLGLSAVLPAYQFWPEWNVPGVAIFNATITGLMVPGALALLVARSLRSEASAGQGLRWAAAVTGGVLVLTGLLVDIRHLFHPEVLQGPSGLIERYTYSAGMLAMAFTALVLGTRLNSQPLRYGSLVIMLATVGKLFLFDVGGLEGIWRVASFVAMGVALLATSWFYGRYVFGKRPAAHQQPAQ